MKDVLVKIYYVGIFFVILCTITSCGQIASLLAPSDVKNATSLPAVLYVAPAGPNGMRDIFIRNSDGKHTNITNSPKKDDFRPSWSKDGSKIIFSSVFVIDNRIEIQIFIINRDGSGETQLTNGTSRYISADISPRGNRIVYSSRSNAFTGNGFTGLYILDIGSSMPTLLSKDGRNPKWSPDGEKIVFSRYSDIFVINANGMDLKKLTSFGIDFISKVTTSGDPNTYAQYPSWSRDGTKILFELKEPLYLPRSEEILSIHTINMMDSDGKNKKQLFVDKGNNPGSSSFTLYGSLISFIRTLDDGSENIFIMNSDGSDVINLGGLHGSTAQR